MVTRTMIQTASGGITLKQIIEDYEKNPNVRYSVTVGFSVFINAQDLPVVANFLTSNKIEVVTSIDWGGQASFGFRKSKTKNPCIVTLKEFSNSTTNKVVESRRFFIILKNGYYFESIWDSLPVNVDPKTGEKIKIDPNLIGVKNSTILISPLGHGKETTLIAAHGEEIYTQMGVKTHPQMVEGYRKWKRI